MTEEAMFSFIKSKNLISEYDEFILDKMKLSRKIRLQLFISSKTLGMEFEVYYQRVYNGGYE